MAAYAALVSLAQVLDQILHPHQQHYVLAHEKEQIKPLRENIISLLTFLEDNPGEAGKFEARITTAANQAEDIIEYRISYEIRSEYGETGNFEARITIAANQAEDIIDLHISDEILDTDLKHHKRQSLYGKLHESIKEIDSILKEVMQIKSSNRSNDLRSSHSSGSSSNSSSRGPKGKDTVVGFQEGLMEIKDRLCGNKSKLQIIPIVGMGGIGKTTLARYAYDDPSIVHHFYFCAWVTVSQDYDARRILLDILHFIDASNKEQYEEMSDELLVERVYKYLKGRRYLIVMDDVWNTNVWDNVRMIFPDDLNGSRVIITTRDSNVGYYADSSSHPYQMQLMDVDQSWRLLREKVFGQENCPSELEKIGKLIAETCGGLPLAIVIIAGVLSKVNQMQDTWESIARNVKEALNASDKQLLVARNVNEALNASSEKLLEILSWSYTHLPHHLRPCFLYMGGFPEDHEIIASKLFKYWEAEGFLKSIASKRLEEVAEEYLEELAKRSLILVIKKRYDGKIKAVKMHDLLRDLCLKKARNENFLHVINDTSSSSTKGIHKRSISSYFWWGSPKVNEFSSSSREGIRHSHRLSILSNHWYGLPYVPRTILLFHHNAILRNLLYQWKSFRLLRVMDALCVKLKSYPVEICKLFHLKYLAFSFLHMGSSKFEIPESLVELKNLQTLILCGYNLSLPPGIWRMRKLRHLILSRGFLPDICDLSHHDLTPPPTLSGREVGPMGMRFICMSRDFLPDPCDQNLFFSWGFLCLVLENLDTLSGVTCFTCSERILKMIPNLKKLGIIYSFEDLNETGWSKYCLKNLVHLQNLEKLNVYAEPYGEGSLSQNIAFPRTLKKLTLCGCGIKWKDMQNIVGSLPNLEALKLKYDACHGFEWETTEGEFLRLRVLLIDRTVLSHWITEGDHFPNLERLVLYDCEGLREIPQCMGEIPTLQLIEVDLRNSSLVESAKCIEEEQRNFGNDDLQVHLLKSRHWSFW